MHHIVYKITNTLNGMYYIGVHSTKRLDDGYMGSGTRLKNAIKKYGIQNFTKEVLSDSETRVEALKKESELVNRDTLTDPFCYNLVSGGGGAPECKPNQPKRFNPDIKYVFMPNEENVKKWRDYIYSLEPESSNAKFILNLTKTVIENWEIFIQGLTVNYNDKKNHKQALQMLGMMQAKNTLDCVYIQEMPWETAKKQGK